MQVQLLNKSLGGLVAVGLLGTALAADRPNFVLILADDLGYADVGFQGCRDIPTPHIDSLAATGVRFTSGYAAHPFCSPTRASLMTGRYQHRFGYENNIAFDPQNPLMGLPLSEKTIPERLKAAGYTTGMVGKWHLGAAHPFHPNRRGFDFFHGFLGGGHDYFSVNLRQAMGEGYQVPIDHNGKPRDIDGYLTEDLTRAAVGFIRSRSGGPFFLYAAYNAPHTPMQAPKERLDRFAAIQNPRRRTYAAMVSILDDGVGEILSALEAGGVRDNTIVCFLSDNGGPTQSNGSNNDPLRGAKGSVFEGGIRVPFVVSWPARLPQGAVYSHPVISHDLSVTALAVAGIPESETRTLDGVNLVPHLLDPGLKPPHEALFWRMNGGSAWAARAGDWKLLQTGANAAPNLYNLADDLSEARDRTEGPALEADPAARLRMRFDQWNQGNRPPFFPGYREYHEVKNKFYRELIGGAD
ncbi:MAG: sulfatase-like hydrolase/transferase [Verrucomicrobiales bacterium]|nr:sulfatase-like hydrolase/transferase [Verrucomicrobiales bacterium]